MQVGEIRKGPPLIAGRWLHVQAHRLMVMIVANDNLQLFDAFHL